MTQFLATLGLVFVAELGDKTQLVALGLGARHRLGPVLTGLVLGFGVVNALSVTIGALLGAALPTRAVNLAGGVLFLAFAVWTLRSGSEGEEKDALGEGAGTITVVATTAVAIIVAELGDKTMLATATLAAKGQPVAVWVGATAGVVGAGSLGVVVGRYAGQRLPERVTRVGAAVLFAVFGVALLITA
ncbi:TMEM165/GDT1 family protein [Rhabdothermincola sediminis]|uniref:TMEM165/GDT1 family protein n=1 Tax=Rhabdothermincola sediminis TaxID=2751370 RepID=UPI001AA01B23|nr:TMEM165/GDT1 family protein [Rhabdothermincola sediminis]